MEEFNEMVEFALACNLDGQTTEDIVAGLEESFKEILEERKSDSHYELGTSWGPIYPMVILTHYSKPHKIRIETRIRINNV